MRKKEKRLIIAFFSTHDAMAFEEVCRQSGAPGRLIPLPRDISAGCGLAWSCPPDERETALRLLDGAGISAQHLRELEI